MAITLADFTKIWASTSPLTPYTFNDANYKQGWNFVGATPPARQMWDSIQNQNDEKLKYIVDNFLPLAGGTMEGAISFDETGQIGYRATTHETPANPCKQLIVSSTDIDHWSEEAGAKMSLHTYDSTGTNTKEDGGFSLLATDGTNNKTLYGKPDGDLTWNYKSIDIVNSSGANYIRYENGLQICWDTTASKTTNAGTSTTTTITFPVAFKDTNYTVTFIDWFGANNWQNHTFCTNSYSTTSVGLYLQNNGDGFYTYSLKWMAIGYWK